jgi:chaperonin GroEL
MKQSRSRTVVFQPNTYRGLVRGTNQIVAAISPTLGPLPRTVASPRQTRTQAPDILDSGGSIANKITGLPHPEEDTGAMFLRQALTELHEQVGDGTATAAVLFQAVFTQGIRYIVAGGDAMQLRQHLERGLQVILDELDGMTMPVEGKTKLSHIAESICSDPPLAKILGEIFDIIGEYGQLNIRSGRSREIKRQYVEGMHWKRGLVSREMITNHVQIRTDLENPAILITDLEIEDPQELVPVINSVIEAEIGALLIVAGKLSPGAVALLVKNMQPDKFQVIAVRPPGLGAEDQVAALEDMAILTGGRPLIGAAGQTLKSCRLEDLGRARRVWADPNNFGIIGGKGNPRQLRRHIAGLRAAFARTRDQDARRELQQRIGKLLGGSATLWTGGVTEPEIRARQELAQRTADALRGAVLEGVLPGGGVSLLACRPALQQKLEQSSSLDEQTAYAILIKAVEQPIRTIVANAGYDAGEVLAQIKLTGAEYGFDTISGQIVNPVSVGILDVATVLRQAVQCAITSAALALTVEVLVHGNRSAATAATVST